MVVHSFSPRPWETEGVRSLSSRPAWPTERVPGLLEIYRETLFRKQQQHNNNNSQQGDSADKSVYHTSLTTGI